MTERLSQIINQRWLLHAGPARATCAEQLSARSQTTNPPNSTGTAWRQGLDARVCNSVQNAKQLAEIEAATIVVALSP